MIRLTIDNKNIQVPQGTTILEAAQKLEIHIPTLCFAAGYKPTTSCMVCVVRVEGLKTLVPACGMQSTDGMIVTTHNAEIEKARKTAIELLLSDHIGDCVGPCQRGCPADMNIPLMIRQIADGDFIEAIKTVKKDIPLPAVLGRICSAPCEKVCRRTQADGAVSICLLKRFVADVDLTSENPYRPDCAPETGKKVAIIGAGPCGLSAVYYLRQAGIACTLFDAHEQPGGSLRYGSLSSQQLPSEVLDKEINQILSLDVELKLNARLMQESLEQLQRQYDAVLLAAGQLSEDFGVAVNGNKIQITRPEYMTSLEGVFAAGRCTRLTCLCVRAVADGKEAADAIKAYVLEGDKSLKDEYNHQMGRLDDEEMAFFLKQASNQQRNVPENDASGLSTEQARAEALRCLHCDCRKADNCRLRDLATELAARRNVWPGSNGVFEQLTSHEQVIYEPGKCIKCGLCVQTAQKAGENLGLSFEGRGFEMQIAAPMHQSLDAALQMAAPDCIKICPTGALALNK